MRSGGSRGQPHNLTGWDHPRTRSFKLAGVNDCLERAKVPAMPFHSARHSAATLLLSRGVHPKIVSEMLGHSTVAITLDVYSHVTPAMHREAARVMDELFS